MNTRNPALDDDLDTLLAAALAPYRDAVPPARGWKQLVRRLVWGGALFWRARFWGMGWGTPSLVSPDAPQRLAGTQGRWTAPPVVGATISRMQALRLTS